MNNIDLEFKKDNQSILKIHRELESVREKLSVEVEKIRRASVEKLYGDRVLNCCQRIQVINNQLTFLVVQLTLLEIETDY
jgi:hypothetical protein